MFDPVRETAAAIDGVLAGYLRIPVAKALNPNDPRDFLVLVKQLTNALVGVTGPAEAKALRSALNILDVDWPNLSQAQRNKVIAASKKALGYPIKVNPPKVEKTLNVSGRGIYDGTVKDAKAQYKLNIATDFTKTDEKVLQAVAFSHAHYVRDEYGKRQEGASIRAREIVTQGLEQGWGRKEIGKALEQGLTAYNLNRSRNYYNLVAGVYANRARGYANLTAYQRGFITHFTFEAVLDERTSEVCRALHGKRFSVQSAMESYTRVAEADEPEAVKSEQPWLQTNKAGEIYYKDAKGAKTVIGAVNESAVGQKGKVGDYSLNLTDDELGARGLSTPPLHGHCRSTIIADTDSIEIPPSLVAPPQPAQPAQPAFALTPPEPAPPPPPRPEPAQAPPPREQETFVFGVGGISNEPIKLVPKPAPPPPVTYQDKAKQKFQKIIDAYGPSEDFIDVGAYSIKSAPPSKFADDIAAAIADMKATKKPAFVKSSKKAIGQLKAESKQKVNVENALALAADPKKLAKQEIFAVELPPAPGKKKGVTIIVDGIDAAVAHDALDAAGAPKTAGHGNPKVKVLSLPKWKAWKAEQAAAARAAAAASKPVAPALTHVPLPGKVDAATILATKTGNAKGSNEGGFYTGADGVARYVKFYKDPAQAHGEVLANSIYKSLGHGAPTGVTVEHEGKQLYAGTILKGKTLGDAGLTRERARKFMEGFAADVLTGNWDAAGLSVDNAFVLDDGGIARIDNGGTFLMRAQAGRKPTGLLNQISEWDKFFDGSNPGYKRVADAAGYSSVEDFKGDVVKGIKQITKLRQSFGGWSNYVDAYAPGLKGADRDAVVSMLEARTSLLEAKLPGLEQVVAPKAPIVSPGMAYRAPSLGGTAPRPGLKVDDLALASRGLKTRRDASVPGTGEDPYDFRATSLKQMKVLKPASSAAVTEFTSNAYGAMRDEEYRHATAGVPLTNRTQKMGEAFSQTSSPGRTTYRKIHSIPTPIVEKMIQNDGIFRLGHDNTPATASSSWDESVAREWVKDYSASRPGSHHIIFMLHQRSAIHIESISEIKSEREFLLPRTAEFRVLRSARFPDNPDAILIELEEI